MSARVDLSGTPLHPFRFPSLANSVAAEPEHEPARPDEKMSPESALPLPDPAAADGAIPAADQIAAEIDSARAAGLESGFREGREEGFAAGHAEGVAAARASLAEEARRLAAIAAQLGQPLAALEQPVEEAVVALALEIARCVIGGEVKRSHEFLVGLVREAIAKVPVDMGAPRVLLNPCDIDLIRDLLPEVATGDAELVGDETIEPGGCLVIADGDARANKDRRWSPRSTEGVSQVNLTLASRWRAVMLTLFDGEDG